MNGRVLTSFVVLVIAMGTGLAVLPSVACHSGSSATDPDGRSDSQDAVQTFEATLTCDPQYNTLPTTVKTCVNLRNLVDSPRVVDGQIDLWLGGGAAPYYNWRFRAVDLAAGGTWEQCWNNQVMDRQSLAEKNIVRLFAVDVTPPPYNQPPYPPSGATATDVCFFWGNNP